MPVKPEIILSLVNSAFPDSEVVLNDTVGDQDHYELIITSEKFNGKNRILQHRMVMEALGDMVGKNLHAISIKSQPKII